MMHIDYCIVVRSELKETLNHNQNEVDIAKQHVTNYRHQLTGEVVMCDFSVREMLILRVTRLLLLSLS